jgi:hypothetical protein
MAVNVQRGNDVSLDGWSNLVGGVFGSSTMCYWFDCFGVCAAPTLLLSFGRWVVNQK